MSHPTRWALALLLVACGDKANNDDTGGALVDADGDGFDASSDCDDQDEAINPDAIEQCDRVDNDCDGDIDEDAEGSLTWYLDADGDGYGDDGETSLACEAPSASHTEVGGDCNDADSDFHPGAPEEDCTDPNDYNCDGSVGYEDADGDGYPACGDDCDDADSEVNPGAIEVCDSIDNDCDGLTDDADDGVDLATGSTFYADADADTYGDPLSATLACEQPAEHVADDTDCNDEDPAINPGAMELCDEEDNDCDGTTDEDDAADAPTWYADSDSDSYGDAATTAVACEAPANHVADATDCDDDEAAINPGATEICDEEDNDCDSDIDEDDAADASTWYADSDGDTYGDPDASAPACSQPSDYVADDTDCDDDDAAVNPAATEVCDEQDNDCDGDTDEDDADDAATWYADTDGDSYGDPDSSTLACEAPSSYVADDTDCDDGDTAINPGATEVCDEEDNDCDGDIDEDDASDASTWYADGDGDDYGVDTDTLTQCEQPTGYAAVDGDCDDDETAANPGELEVCGDGIDNDCDETANGCDISGDIALADAEALWSGEAAGDLAGAALATVGDQDGDGFVDFLVGATDHDGGATDAGRVYLVSGASTGSASLGSALSTIDGRSASDYLGASLSPAGDVDGDAYADFLISAYKDDTAHTDAGSVGVFLGPVSGALDLDEAWAEVLGESSYDFAGSAIAGGGSVNDTAGTDMLVGAYRDDDGGGNAGAIYLLAGVATGATDLSLAEGKRYGVAANDYSGWSVALLGDVDGDGVHDVATGAYLNDDAASNAGAAYVVNGPITGTASLSTADAILLGESSTAYAGYSLAGGGDLDGDGTNDLVVGSYGYDGSGTNYGRAYLVAGPMTSGGLSSATAVLTGNSSYDNFGQAVAIVGDVDGDGNDDLAVGARGDDYASSGDGITYLFLGPLSGSLSTSDAEAVLYGEAAGDSSGSAVTGGDGDGDGYSDLLISAPEADSDAGAVYLLRGGSW